MPVCTEGVARTASFPSGVTAARATRGVFSPTHMMLLNVLRMDPADPFGTSYIRSSIVSVGGDERHPTRQKKRRNAGTVRRRKKLMPLLPARKKFLHPSS